MVDENYISLQEATKFCNYSQEYLSLRARQGKLKSVKFGRNWVTKKEWLDEYVKIAEEYNNNFNNNHNKKLGVKKIIAPPENLPTGVEPQSVLRFGFVVALVFVLLFAGITFGNDSFKYVYNQADPVVREISQSLDFSEQVKSFRNVYKQASSLVQETNQNFDRGAIAISSKFNESAIHFTSEFKVQSSKLTEEISDHTYIIAQAGNNFLDSAISNGASQIAGIGGLFKEYGQWIVRSYFTANNFVEEKLIHGYKAFSQLWKRSGEVVEEKLIPKPAKEGMVVVPSTELAEEVKKRIKESFSDEVRVEPQDESSGIIIPIFKEGEGEKYFYILVPIKDN